MKKKTLILLTAMAVTVGCFTGCGSESTTDTQKTETTETTESTATSDTTEDETEVEETTTEDTKDFDGSELSDTGSGTFYISTAAGTSEDGSAPVLFVEEDTLLVQIGYTARDFDGSHLSFIYVDGMETDKSQIADTDGTLDLSEDALSTGTHTVEVVQYDSDDATGNVITYKSASYEVK